MKKHLLKGLYLGLAIFITVEIIAPYLGLTDKEITANDIARGLVVWTFAGLVYGGLDFIFRPKPIDKQ